MEDTKHLVHFKDGSKRVLTATELHALDPEAYHAQEPADRDRFIVQPRIVDDVVVFDVIDRTGEQGITTCPTRQGAEALAKELNR